MVKPLAPGSGRRQADGMAQCLARGATTRLGGTSESSRKLVRTGVSQAECAAGPPLWGGRLGAADGEAVRDGIHAAASWAAEGLMRTLSSPAESHRQALPEADVNLSIHPAPIVQPVTPAPNGQTGQVGGRGPATTIAMLAPCVRGVFCICVAPIAPENHPVCAGRDGEKWPRKFEQAVKWRICDR